ncbi:cytochrome P450 3A6-like [Ixodes scapularis]|uniref:cytochrome P450 3A6-like n=1 Tax=Ixodes scapularis TaxID=6945 RepID=UPI001A9D47F4|nr:cytochrome P450 3A6-like [Ixodes scapularis]
MADLIWKVLASPLLLLVPSILLFWAFRRRRAHGLFRRNGIPGPEPELFWGNWKQLKKNRIQVLQQWIEEYGQVFGFFMAEKPWMVVTDLDLVRQIFVTEANTFTDRPQYVIDVEPFTSALPFLPGDEWKKVRPVLNTSLTAGKMNLLSGIVSECAREFLEVLRKHHERKDVVNFVEAAEGYALDVITRVGLTWNTKCQQKSDDPLLLGLRWIFEDLDKTAVENTLAQPGIRTILRHLYPLTSFSKVLSRIAKNVRDTAHKRRQGQAPREKDILQAMLDAQDGVEDKECDSCLPLEHGAWRKNGIHKNGLLIEDRHLTSNSIMVLIANFETTSATIGFTLHLLATHPEEQDKLFLEIDAMLPQTSETSLNNLQNMTRLDMVVKESLRLYPPIPILVTRVCPRDTTVMKQFIPAGTMVVAPAWHIHRSPQFWNDPSRFLPDRFAQDQPERHPFAYFPFGLGPRSCFGKRLAVLQVKTAIVEILRNYRVLPCGETVDPIRVTVPNVLLRPVGGIKLRLASRR